MKRIKINWIAFACSFGATAAIVFTAFSIFADVPQPVLKISSLGSNQFSIAITNSVSTTNYTLFWTPALGDEAYSWQVLTVGNVGQSNFTIDAGTWPVGFFRGLIGADQDGDGIPEWQDAQPSNPSVGILSLIIDSPLNGGTIN